MYIKNWKYAFWYIIIVAKINCAYKIHRINKKLLKKTQNMGIINI